MTFQGFLKADTQQIVTIGPSLAVADGYTMDTTLAISTADEANLLKYGGTTVVDLATRTWNAVSNGDGYFSLTLIASDLDTEGMIRIMIEDESVCYPIVADFMVVNANIYDSLFGAGTVYLKTDIAKWLTQAVTADASNVPDVNVASFDAAADFGAGLKADINAEVLDVIAVDQQTAWVTAGNPLPSDTPTMLEMLQFIYYVGRGRYKIVWDGDSVDVYDDNDAKMFSASLSAIATALTEGKFADA